MTKEEKAKELGLKYFPNEENIWARGNIEAQRVEAACLEMAEWSNENLFNEICNWLTTHTNYIYQGTNGSYYYAISQLIKDLREDIKNPHYPRFKSGNTIISIKCPKIKRIITGVNEELGEYYNKDINGESHTNSIYYIDNNFMLSND